MTENKSSKEPIIAPKQDGKKPLIYGAIAVLIIILCVKIYLDYVDKNEIQAHFNEELTLAKERFDQISSELEEKIQAIDSLGGNIDSLIIARDELTAERDQLQRTRTANRKLLRRLSNKTEGYEILLKEKDKEIANLIETNEKLLSENTDLKTEANVLNRSIVSLNEDKQQLVDKVATASRLEVENLAISSVSSSGRERDGILRVRQLDVLKVTFSIAKNDVAPKEAKKIMIKLTDKNGQILFDVSKGSGTFLIDGKETFYTEAQDILFDNSGQDLTFLYKKGSEYEPGEYTMDVYTDEYKMGTKKFSVK